MFLLIIDLLANIAWSNIATRVETSHPDPTSQLRSQYVQSRPSLENKIVYLARYAYWCTSILISGGVRFSLSDSLQSQSRLIDLTAVKGKSALLEVYEVLNPDITDHYSSKLETSEILEKVVKYFFDNKILNFSVKMILLNSFIFLLAVSFDMPNASIISLMSGLCLRI